MFHPAPAAAFDPASALDRLAGDELLLREVIQLYLDHADTMLEPVRAAVTAQNPAGLEHAAHTLKGAVASLGGVDTAGAAHVLEQMGRENRLADAGAAWERLEEADRALRPLLAAWLAR